MSIEELENTVLENVKQNFSELDNKDSINKLYRQARTWVRFMWVFGKAITQERSWELNGKLKQLRWDRLKELGY